MNTLDELLKLIKRLHPNAYLEGSSQGYRVVVPTSDKEDWVSRRTDCDSLLRELSKLINN